MVDEDIDEDAFPSVGREPVEENYVENVGGLLEYDEENEMDDEN